MKKILEKLKEIKKSISYYENGNKRKEKIKVIEKEKLFEISEKNNVSNERQSFNILNQDNQKEDEDINGKQAPNKEGIKKSLSDQIKDLFKNEIFWIALPIIFSIIYFAIDGYYKIFMGRNYNLPSEYFSIPLSEVFYYLFLLFGIPITLIIIGIFLKKMNTILEKTLSFIIKIPILIIIFLFWYIDIYLKIEVILKENYYFLILLILYIIFTIGTVIFYIFCSNNTKKYGIVYLINWVLHFLVIIYLLFLVEKKEYEIFYKDRKPKVIIATYEDKYLITECKIDYKNSKLIINTEDYEFIDINEAKKISYINFNEISKIETDKNKKEVNK
ncbi:hypothetical protein [Fusobacterium polymorphum]|uniref:hypothetical protein n=1 Tax=Fusobacterium nucleatum subsp. polymorphum TaxID=76857 RepID=UPI000BFC8663|nr:hypothetical protein [Fusobacterium polymorphum]PHI09221.1 hypothetical protein CA845_03865 [Fusobacterium polymorphum]